MTSNKFELAGKVDELLKDEDKTVALEALRIVMLEMYNQMQTEVMDLANMNVVGGKQ